MIGRRKIVTIGGLMLGLFAASTTSGLGETGDLTGADLDDICNAPVFDRNRDLWCNIYLRGYLEGLAIGAGLQKLGLSYCPPKNLTVREGRLIVGKYLRDHSTEMKLDAAILAARALLAAYPCP